MTTNTCKHNLADHQEGKECPLCREELALQMRISTARITAEKWQENMRLCLERDEVNRRWIIRDEAAAMLNLEVME